MPWTCYKYWLSDQYTHQTPHKNTSFHSQRNSEHYPLHTWLKISYMHSLNNSQANERRDQRPKCIYASNPQLKSNISQCCFFSSNLLSNHQNNSKICSLIFLYFYWHLFLCHSYFFVLSTVWRFTHLLPSQGLILSQGTAYQHIGSTRWFGHLMLKALKGWVSRYMQVRHTHVWPLSSVFTLTEEVSLIAYVHYIY